MKIEKEQKENVTLFKDVEEGQCFRHDTGGFYIKVTRFDSTINCINLRDGASGTCYKNSKVKLFENAKVVLGE